MTYLDQNETSPGNGLKSNEQVLIDDYDFSIGELISEGLDLFKKGAGNYVAFTLVFLIISVILGLIPIIGTLASLLITPPLSAGFFIVTDQPSREKVAQKQKHPHDFFVGVCVGVYFSISSLITL